MKYGILFGLLLGYPLCCIKYFEDNGEILKSYEGYCPCPECVKMTREELMKRLGRDTKDEPKELREFSNATLKVDDDDESFKIGCNVYKDKEDFFISAWVASEMLEERWRDLYPLAGNPA